MPRLNSLSPASVQPNWFVEHEASLPSAAARPTPRQLGLRRPCANLQRQIAAVVHEQER
jgi:hypothetical protein